MSKVKKIVVTGGAGQIAYSLLFRIASGEMLGADQQVELSILEVPEAEAALKGVIMELIDCAFPLLHKVTAHTDPREAFHGADIALLVGASPRGPGMERKDLLEQNAKIFREQGKALGETADPNCLVLVVGNPCNTNALITLHHGKGLNSRRIYAMTRLDENRAKGQLSLKSGQPVREVKNMTIWGNHSSTQVPDFSHATIGESPAEKVIGDRSWLEGPFIETVQKRGAEVIAARGKSSAASAANAVLETVRALFTETEPGDWFSISAYTKGSSYKIDENLIFSFPCTSDGEGNVTIIDGLKWDPFIKEKIEETEEELIEERSAVLSSPSA